jgi:RHH-type transcriptional regulator, rel operon repressor / antitoxin RelB
MTLSIRLSSEIEERLETLSKKTGRTKVFYVREMIEDNIDDVEDYYMGASVLEKIRRGKEKLHDAQFVREELGLAD